MTWSPTRSSCSVWPATGLAITVATEATARRIVEAHGLRAARSSLVSTWAGMVGDAAVSVRIDDTPTVRGAA